MTMRIQVLAGSILTLVAYGAASRAGSDTGQPVPFDDASVRFEQNVTDGDVEVVFQITGGDEGLATLTVVSPDGRTVVDFTAPDVSTLGIRSFEFESPEPKDIEGLKTAYPEGTYTFNGSTQAGEKLYGESTLYHQLPTPVSFLRPGADATGVGTENLEITWTPVDDAVAYIIEIEQDELNMKIKAQLPKSTDAFVVPAVLLPSVEYDLSIGTVSPQGNISIVETTFSTSE
jgi:hypothetical protein